MTKVNRFALLILLTLTLQLSFSQKSLFGTWTVSCPPEKIDAASVKFCGLCPTTQSNQSSISINDFEIAIDKTEIKINMDGNITPIKYNWDDELQAIEFQYKDSRYKFKVLSSEQNNFRILKNNDGQLIILAKKQ